MGIGVGFPVEEINGNKIHRIHSNGFQEWIIYLGHIMVSYEDSNGTYIEFDDYGNEIRYTIPKAN